MIIITNNLSELVNSLALQEDYIKYCND